MPRRVFPSRDAAELCPQSILMSFIRVEDLILRHSSYTNWLLILALIGSIGEGEQILNYLTTEISFQDAPILGQYEKNISDKLNIHFYFHYYFTHTATLHWIRSIKDGCISLSNIAPGTVTSSQINLFLSCQVCDLRRRATRHQHVRELAHLESWSWNSRRACACITHF